VAVLDPDSWELPAFAERAGPPTEKQTKEAKEAAEKGETEKEKEILSENARLLFERIRQYAFTGKNSTAEIAAPGCTQQESFKPIYGSGPSTQYQHTFEQSGAP